MIPRGIGIPLLIAVVCVGAIAYLSSQDKAVKVNDQGVPVQAPAPPPYTGPVPNPMDPANAGGAPPPGGVATFPAPPPAILPTVPAGTFRSLDKINAAAKAVGCDELRPDDPAGKLIDVAECLGAKAQAK